MLNFSDLHSKLRWERSDNSPYYEQAIKEVKNDGLWLEFGSWSGRTLQIFQN